MTTYPFRQKRDKIMITFICENCGHKFKRGIKHLFVHIPTMLEELEKKTTKHSSIIIPYEMICPQCSAVNQYKLDMYSSTRVMMFFLTSEMMKGDLFIHNYYHFTSFGLNDGTACHPLDAITYYQERLSKDAHHLDNHLRLAHSFRIVGLFNEAEEQYEQILARDKSKSEAWFGLASIHISRNKRRLTKSALKNLLDNLPKNATQDESDYAAHAQACLSGLSPLESMATDEMLLEGFKKYAENTKAMDIKTEKKRKRRMKPKSNR
jgi:tetratricopeptide (TPR) repeat protein